MRINYKTSIAIDVPAENLFKAISAYLGQWWGKPDRTIEEIGTIFRVSWDNLWYEFELIEFEKDRRMIWKCIDANQKINGLEGVEKEWVGTEICWSLDSPEKEKTLLKFEHRGLVPDLACYEFCSKTWDRFLKDDLVRFVTSE